MLILRQPDFVMEVRWRCMGWKYGGISRVSRLYPSVVEEKQSCGQMF